MRILQCIELFRCLHWIYIHMTAWMEHIECWAWRAFRMDKDQTLLINWNEWREFHLLHPVTDVKEIMKYWRHSGVGYFYIKTRFSYFSQLRISHIKNIHGYEYIMTFFFVHVWQIFCDVVHTLSGCIAAVRWDVSWPWTWSFDRKKSSIDKFLASSYMFYFIMTCLQMF